MDGNVGCELEQEECDKVSCQKCAEEAVEEYEKAICEKVFSWVTENIVINCCDCPVFGCNDKAHCKENLIKEMRESNE